MGGAIDLVKILLSCIELSRSFPLDLQPLDKGLPEDTSLNHYSHTIPSVSTSITNTLSMLCYTSVEGNHRSLRLITLSDNIIFTEHFFMILSHGRYCTFFPTLPLFSLSN